MKSSVEDRNLREAVAKYGARGKDSFDIRRIVERREIDAFFYAAEHIIVNDGTLGEAFTAMHNAMTNCMNVCDALNPGDPSFRACPVHYQLHSGSRVA